jgi:predicted AlkP superfamily phosphohydrolase/phosphomutase
VAGARTVYLGIDGADLRLAEEFAQCGAMPNLARLLDTAAIVETVGPVGYFTSALWPTLYTGLTASRHHYICWNEITGGTYDYHETDPDALVGRAVWQALSDAGRRVAVLDAPHAPLATALNGVQLVEWGAHDRHRVTCSYPASFLDEVNDRFGPHPVGCATPPARQFSPCDYHHRRGDHREPEENVALLADLLEGHRRKAALARHLLDRERWDLFFGVVSETHCVGHQLWHLHDAEHPRHDPVERAALGDPLERVYAAVDGTIGEHLARVTDDGVLYLHFSHGMGPHYDGTQVIDPLLWRLDEYVSGVASIGWRTRTTDRLTGALPANVRRRMLGEVAKLRRRVESRFPFGEFTDQIPPPNDRRWWAQPNNTVDASIRLNVEHREPDGRIIASERRAAARWLAERMLEVVNLDTGEPIVTAVFETDDHYERFDGDAFGDLIVEWNRSSPIERVWSPATGVVHVPFRQWRAGDHHRRGMLLAVGTGIRGGRRTEPLDVVHLGPTIAASLGVELPATDGRPVWELVPGAERRGADLPGGTRSMREQPAPRGPRSWSSRYEVPEVVRVDRRLRGLMDAHHATRLGVEAVQRDVAQTSVAEDRLRELERMASIATTSAWLRQIEVPPSVLVSVVTPTRNRALWLQHAIASVRAQRYQHWEMLVVDDGSTDETPEVLASFADDERIRPLRIEPSGVSRARNHALENARGEVVVYLDDDNRFDPDWLHAVVWAFTAYPDSTVCYGARIVDDFDRHHTGQAGGLPWVQFLPWDRDAVEEFNRVDMNVLAHRPSPARFDPGLGYFADWDLLLKLTDATDPLELPVIAVYYTTDASERLTAVVGTPVIDLEYERVRDETARRRTVS